MTFEEHRRTEIRDHDPYDRDPYDRDPGLAPPRRVSSDRIVTTRASGAEVASRLVIFLFGLVQLVIALRILFLAIGAREGNAIVSFVLDLSRPLVDPFVGMLGTDALRSGSGAVLDGTAILALIGWTVLEVIVLAFVRLLRRGPA